MWGICKVFLCCYNRNVFPKHKLRICQPTSLHITSNCLLASEVHFIQSTSSKPITHSSSSSSSSTSTSSSSSSSKTISTNNVFPSSYLNSYERVINFEFTEQTIYDLIEKELSNETDYEQFYSQNNLTISIKASGSIFSKDFPLIKMKYILSKKEFIEGTNIKLLDFYMNDPSTRKKWDKGLNEYKKIKGDNKMYLVYSLTTKPMLFVSERDIIEKRYDFYIGDVYYDFSSSVNDEFYPCDNSSYVRAVNIFCGYKMYEQDNSFVFESLSQSDVKMSIPNSVYKTTMPNKYKTWYDKLKEIVNTHVFESSGNNSHNTNGSMSTHDNSNSSSVNEINDDDNDEQQTLKD